MTGRKRTPPGTLEERLKAKGELAEITADLPREELNALTAKAIAEDSEVMTVPNMKRPELRSDSDPTEIMKRPSWEHVPKAKPRIRKQTLVGMGSVNVEPGVP